MKCYGINLATDEPVGVNFNSTIEWVEPLIGEVVDAPLLAPGWVDVQINGFAGVDFNDPEASPEAIALSLRALHACGVTRILPTIITGPHERMAAALRNLVRARSQVENGETIEAFHVEGPWISPEDGPRGAHPKQWVRPPSLDEFERLQEAAQGLIRLVTVAPEWPEAPRFIETLVGRGIVVSIGHTDATSAQIAAAVDAGATMSTHLGNAARRLLDRRSNCLWDQLAEDRLAAGFIVDGIHLSPAFLKVALRAKGVERSILVTDAVAPAGCSPGRYKVGELEVELTADGRVHLAGEETLAGSALTMDRGIENLMRIAGLTLREAVTMASRNPARVVRITGRQRGLAPGDRADMVEFRFDSRQKKIRIERTWLSGRQVWCAPH